MDVQHSVSVLVCTRCRLSALGMMDRRLLSPRKLSTGEPVCPSFLRQTSEQIRLGGRHLSQIQEESDSREQSTCFLPPIVRHKQPSGRPGVDEGQRRESGCPSDRASVALNEQQRKLEDNRGLLEELSRIEAELRESLRLDVERQREAEFLRQQENKLMRFDLCYLGLSQRVGKPWVSSYFRKFPMHMYCLPVQAANHRGRRRGLKKRT